MTAMVPGPGSVPQTLPNYVLMWATPTFAKKEWPALGLFGAGGPLLEPFPGSLHPPSPLLAPYEEMMMQCRWVAGEVEE
ncbi:hypothetical protein BOTCAL_0405g00010 [Botryotinia calthae]|uniref:Uncharacterized protein n=1 Tax=Botryotinia calthae TaxID=38488 RepID=A0A4Y8CQ44_9HELO|nr:hypothetical protein BOTCAL_0405g00010 [Botryotinia calthae]